jgi:hypothetical protein
MSKHMHLYIHKYVYVHIYTYLHRYIYIYMCINIYIYIHIQIYIDTYIICHLDDVEKAHDGATKAVATLTNVKIVIIKIILQYTVIRNIQI